MAEHSSAQGQAALAPNAACHAAPPTPPEACHTHCGTGTLPPLKWRCLFGCRRRSRRSRRRAAASGTRCGGGRRGRSRAARRACDTSAVHQRPAAARHGVPLCQPQARSSRPPTYVPNCRHYTPPCLSWMSASAQTRCQWWSLATPSRRAACLPASRRRTAAGSSVRARRRLCRCRLLQRLRPAGIVAYRRLCRLPYVQPAGLS